jgi:23S rRNA pseudouridine955/2504/2580 synthase
MELKTGENDANRRLDRVLRKALRDHPLSLIHRLLRRNQVLVDGRPAEPGDRVTAGAIITLPDIAPASRSRKPASKLPDAGHPLEILWRGSGLLILNKPPGLAVHGPGSLDTMVNAYLAGELSPSLSFRPGPLHRLDKPTSGIIVFSTGLEGARRFSALLRERRIKKRYLVLVEGRVTESALWRDALVRDKDAKKTMIAAGSGAGIAVTRVRPLAANAAYSLLLAEIETGRTHQIRVQAAAHGHPLWGDVKYGGHAAGGGRRGGGFFLHAWKLQLCETPPAVSAAPECSAFPSCITAPPPEIFRNRIAALFGEEIPV